ncbi:hypothetical protein ACHAAC_17260 [Aeromicrobium sp. CF4.19]|uniref:hypothetical protein n=1 Tax=Aeromicrobium sp. CF4.19 TaxID=3373082 RepID=UPI003EE5F140
MTSSGQDRSSRGSRRWWLGWFAAALVLNLVLDLLLDPPVFVRWGVVVLAVVVAMLAVGPRASARRAGSREPR